MRFEKGACKEDVARPTCGVPSAMGASGCISADQFVAQGETVYALTGVVGGKGGSEMSIRTFRVWRQASMSTTTTSYHPRREWGRGSSETERHRPLSGVGLLNGHEWAKRQAALRGSIFAELDNGFRPCRLRTRARWSAICASLGHEHVQAFFDRWMRVLPSPLIAAERSRYHYRLSIRQLEMSDTHVFDRPAAGRVV